MLEQFVQTQIFLFYTLLWVFMKKMMNGYTFMGSSSAFFHFCLPSQGDGVALKKSDFLLLQLFFLLVIYYYYYFCEERPPLGRVVMLREANRNSSPL